MDMNMYQWMRNTDEMLERLSVAISELDHRISELEGEDGENNAS